MVAFRESFDRTKPVEVLRPFISNGRHLQPGDAFEWRRSMLNERRVAQLFTAGYLRHVRVAEDPEPQEATEGQEGSTTATEGQEGQDGASEGQEGSQEATEGQEAAQEPTDDPRIVHLGGGWYDVLGPNGEPVNEKGLREDDAVALLAGLKAQEEGAAA